MKSVLLIGLGDFGKHIAVKLNELNYEVMAVDKCEESVNHILPYVTNAQIGDSTDEEFMSSLGIDNYDLCIVAVGDNFESSLQTTALLKELGARKIVTHAASDVHQKFLLRNGADDVIYPEKQLAAWVAIRYTSDNILDYIELDENNSIYELSVPSQWHGKTVVQLDIRRKHDINIIAIKKDGKLSMSISADTVLTDDMSVLVGGTNKEIQKFLRVIDR